jgi:hypothetical protein
MASDFPIQYYSYKEGGPMNEYFVPDAAQTITFGELVFQNTTDQEIEECGADPALILGIAEGNSADKWLWDGRIPVHVLSPNVMIGLCVTGTLAASDSGKSYGIVKKASGNWAIDLSETVNTRVVVRKADVTNQIAWVQFLAANLQHDAIAS